MVLLGSRRLLEFLEFSIIVMTMVAARVGDLIAFVLVAAEKNIVAKHYLFIDPI